MNFCTRDEYKSHTFGHFSVKSCSECHVLLVKICDEWFELHTPVNCQNNKHVHTFGTSNTENIDGNDIFIKEEPIAEMESVQLDELLNVKTDVESNVFEEVFASNIDMNEDNTFDSTYQPSSNYDTQVEDLNSEFKFRIVSITERVVSNDADAMKHTKGFKCQLCDKIFPSRYRLDCHTQNHHTPVKLITNQQEVRKLKRCKYCNKTFNTFVSLDKHLRRCPSNGRKRSYMKRHPHRPKENLFCDICGSVLKTFQILINHMNEVHSNKCSFKCRVCGRLYPSRYYLKKHLKLHKQAFENDQSNDAIDLDEDLMERRKYVRAHPHRPKSNFTCDICGKNVRTFDLLEGHMNTYHSGGLNFRCRKCGRCYPSRYYLSKHILRHKSVQTNGDNIAIDDLDEGLMERNRYNRLKTCKPEMGLICNECGRVFQYHRQLLEHRSARHSGENKFKCKKCERYYPNRYYLAKHLKRHEEAEKNGISLDELGADLDEGLMERNKYVRQKSTEQQKSSYECDDCDETFRKFCLLTEHRRMKHSNNNGYSCIKCGRRYPNRYYLTKHMKRHQNTTVIIDENDEISIGSDDLMDQKMPIATEMTAQEPKIEFGCESCGMVYNSNEQLTEHMTSNHSENPNFKCNICNSELSNHYYLQKHMTQHQTQPAAADKNIDDDLIVREGYFRVHPHRPSTNFTCDICHKMFSTYYLINDHMKSEHSNKVYKKYTCTKCGKRFEMKKRLERHKILKHREADVNKSKAESKQMCSICGRLFSDKSKMIAHEKTHLGIRPSCDICGKQFLHKTYLGQHIRSVHANVRPFACNIDGCEWSFAYPQSLKRHQARKHGMVTNRNACPICSKEFPDSTYHLKRHLKAHANNTAKEYIPETRENASETSK